MERKGLFLSIGVMDLLRNPRIQYLSDNLDIGKKAYKIHCNGLNKDEIEQYVSPSFYFT